MSDLSQKKDTPQPFYLSPKEAGVLVGYTSDYVSKLSRDGVIVAKRDGRNWLVEGNSLKAFAERVVVEEKKRLEALKEERAKAYKASREFLPLREAGMLFGYTPDYLAKLCRDGSVQAERDGREWFVERASLEEFATNIKLGETSRLASLREVRIQEYQKGKAGLFSAFKKKNGAPRYPIFASTLLGLGAFFLIFFFSYGFLFSGIDFESLARVFRPSPFVAVQNPVATSTPPTKNEPVAMVTNYNTYNNTYNNTTNEYNSQTIEGMSSADLAIELQGFKNTVLSQVYGAISNVSSNVAGNTRAIQLTNRIDNLASVNISGSTFTGGSIANSTITNSNISGGTGSFTTLSVSGDTTLATTTITGPFTLTSIATSSFANGINLSGGCFAVNGVCLSLTGGGGGGAGTWSSTTSSVASQFVNYSNSSTDIVAIGGSATTSAKYWFDPNTQTSYLSGSIGIGTTSPFARFSLAGANGSTSNLFAISTSTGSATTTALTIDSGGNLSLLNGANASISGVLTLARALGIGSGGTGTSTAPSYGQFLVGNQSGGYDYVATSSLGSASGVASLAQVFGSAQTGAITFATSSTAFNGLTANLAITNSSGAFTFAPTLSGTLGVGGGGTGATTYSYGLIYSPGGTTALANIATSSLGLLTTNVAEGSNLYYTDARVNTYINASSTIPKTYTANTFTGANIFNGGLTISTLNGPLHANNGVVSATTSVGTLYGGTGLTSYTLGDTLYASATNVLARLGIGSGGQVLAVSNGIPSWVATSTLSTISGTLSTSQGGTGVNASAYTGIFGINNGVVYNSATTTYSSGLTYASGNVTNTGVLSNIAGAGISVSGATGNVTISNTGLLSLQQLGGGSAQTGAITFATSSTAFNGLTANLAITNSSGAFTFAPTLSGTLGVGGGGTGLSSIASSSLLIGGPGNTFIGYATSSLGIALSDTTGILPINRGGTATTTFYNGGVTFYNSSLGTLSQAGDGVGLFWDETNKRLGLGSTTPAATLGVNGSGYFAGNLGVDRFSTYRQAGTPILYASSSRGTLAVGLNAFNYATTSSGGYYTTAVGTNAAASAQADDITAIGYNALRRTTTGTDHTAVGFSALFSQTSGTYYNTAVGSYAGYTNTSGWRNTSIGAFAAYTANPTNGFITAVGAEALTNATNGDYSTAIGGYAGYGVTSGIENTLVGMSSGYSMVGGSYNTGIGRSALRNSTGTYNVSLGYQAGYDISSGRRNIRIGTTENTGGNNITTGSNNIGIGFNSVFPSATANNQLNFGNTIFGTLTATSTSTSVPTSFTGALIGIASTSPWGRFSVDTGTIGTAPAFVVGSSTATRFIIDNAGNVGIGTTSPYATLSIEGNSALGNTALAGYFIATSTTATSTFSGGFDVTKGITLNSGYIFGAGLAACAGSTDKLLWNATTGKFSCGTDAGAGGGITSIGAFGQAQTGSAQVLATSSDTNIGLTITSTGDVHTFTSTWAGTLATTRGGTGLSSIADGTLIYGSGGTTLSTLASSTGGFLTNSYTTGRPVWSATSTLGIALADTTGTLSETRGGTNQTAYTLGDTLYASATNVLARLGIGSGGQVLAVSNGIPSWVATSTLSTISGTLSTSQGGTGVNASAYNGIFGINNGVVYNSATTTYSSGLTYSAGNVTNTGVLSNIAGTGISVSGATGNVTVSNTGLLSLAQTYGSAQTGAITFATSSDTNLLLNVTNSSGAFTFTPAWTGTLASSRLNSNVVQAITSDTNITGSISAQNLTLGWTGTLATTRGGTGWASVQASALLYGNGTGALATTTAGTNGQVLAYLNGIPTWTATSSIDNGVTSLAQTYGSAQTGAITFATSSTAFNGLTANLAITNSSGAFTFAPTLSGTLGVGGGGTGLSSIASSSLLIGGPGNTFIGYATSSLGVALGDTTGTLGVSRGGTGITSAPTYGQVLLGNASGGYTLTATSSLGITGGVWGTITGTLANQTDLQSALDAKLSLSAWYSTTTDQLTEGSVNRYYTDARVNTYINASTTIPKTYTTNTFTNANTFNGAFTLGTLNGPLHANNGVVSATTSIGTLYGGTGLSTAPSYGNLLLGNSGGGYTLTATSSLGLASIFSATYPVQYASNIISLAFGTTTANSWSALQQFNGGLTSYASTTIGNGTASGGLTVSGSATTTNNLYVAGNLGIGTTSSDALSVAGNLTINQNPGNQLVQRYQHGGINRFAFYTQSDGSFWGLARYDNSGNYLAEALRVMRTNGFLGVGGAFDPVSQLAVNGGTTIGSGYTANTAPTNGLLVQGNVGIGTTSPYAKLSVVGQTVAEYFTATTSTASTFPYASTTALTVSGNTFFTGLTGPNALAINSAGQVYASATSTLSTISGTLSTSQGGTGVNASAYNGIFGINNGVVYNSATTTYSSGLTYASGNVTNTGLLSLQQTGGGSAQTGAITFATSSDTNLLLNVTNSSGAFTFTPAWTGTLASSRLNSNVVQAITSDTNITGSISAQNLTLGWTGTLGATRGGTGLSSIASSSLLIGGPGNTFIGYATSSLGVALSDTTGTLSETRGGTNQTAYTLGDTLYASAANTLARLGIGSGGQVLAVSNGIPSWVASTTLSTISGTLPIAKGGTATTTFYNGGVTFYNSSLGTISQAGDGQGLFWDETNKRLGVGTTTPWAQLSVNPNALGSGVPEFVVGSSSATHLLVSGSGNVSVGYSADQSYKLAVNGNVFFATGVLDLGSSGHRINYTDSNLSISNGSSGNLTLATGGSTRVTLANGGNFGIGTTTPGSLLSIAGDSYTSGFINTSQITGGYKFSGLLVGYASSTNGATIWGLQAGGNDATTTATVRGTTAFGYQALRATTGATGNSAFGYQAGNALTTGAQNTAIGYQALNLATTSPQNTAIGYGALAGTVDGDTFSSVGQNTAIGYQTLNDLTTGYRNVAIGYGALDVATVGIGQVAVGYNALGLNTTGDSNTAVGTGALNLNTTGGSNVSLGYSALNSSVTGSNNVGIGFQASYNNGSATSTVVIGYRAGYGAGTLANQGTVAIGYQAGRLLDVGSDYNTMLGFQAGYNNTTGSKNIQIGSWVTSTNANITTGSNNIIIGNEIQAPSATASNQLNIQNIIFGTGNSGTASTLSTGLIGIGTTTPYANLSINTTAGRDAFAVGSSTGTYFKITSLGTTTALRFDVTGTATSSFGAGINVTTGCFSINNTCVGGSSFSNTIANGGTATTTFYNGGVTFYNSTLGTLSQGTAQSDFFYDVTNKRLGLGTTSPWAQLSINPNALGSGVPEFVIGSSTATHFIVTGAGNVGVGTVAPSANFTVQNNYGSTNSTLFLISSSTATNGSTSASLFSVDSTGVTTIGNSSGTGDANFQFASDANAWSIGYSSSDKSFRIASSTNLSSLVALSISKNGNVGIGSTTPGSLLSIGGTGTGWNFYDNATTTKSGVGGINILQGCFAVNGTCISADAGTNYFTNSGDNTYLSTGTLLGVGTSSPWGQLSVNPNGISGPSFVIGSSSATHFLVTNGGDVGIGSTSPSAKLSVNGSGYFAGNLGIDMFSTYRQAGVPLLYASSSRGTTVVGLNALTYATTSSSGYYTTAIGMYAATGATADDITAVGYKALRSNSGSGGNHTAVGSNALYSLGQGTYYNTAVGAFAGYTNSSGWRNTSLGASAAYTGNPTNGNVTAIGSEALYSATTGDYNTAVGSQAGYTVTTGTENTLVGYSSGNLMGAGSFNTGIGRSSLRSSTGTYNVGLGYQAGYDISSGRRNIRIGTTENTGGNNITTGSNNIGIGFNSVFPSATANNQLNFGNTIFGTLTATSTSTSVPTSFTGALIGIASTSPWGRFSVDTGDIGTAPAFVVGSSTATRFIIDNAGNVGIGTTTPSTNLSVQGNGLFSGTLSASSITATSTISALFFNASQYGGFQQNSNLLGYASTTNTATIWGLGAGGQNATTSATSRGTVAVGYEAFNALTTGANNTAVGYRAGYKTNDQGQNSFFGYEAGAYATTSSQNVAIGYRALKGNTSTFSATLPNTAIGYNALTANTSGGYNTAIGTSALAGNTTGSQSVAIGTFALQSSLSGSNSAIGYNAMGTCTTCASNNAFGNNTLASLTTGQDNSAFGNSSQFRGTTAGANATFGYASLYTNKTGTDNIAFGNDSLRYINNATSTVAIGSGAGADANQTSGTFQNNVFIGYRSGYIATTGANNNTFIGYQTGNALTTGANNILLGYNIDAPSPTLSNQLSIGNLIFGTGVDGEDTTLSTGKIGVGSTTPWGKFSIQNTTAFPSFVVEDSASPDTTPFIIDTSGNVGIGSTAPGGKLDVRDGNFVLTDADVAHGVTDFGDLTTTYAKFLPISGTAGGLGTWALSDTGSDSAYRLTAVLGSADPTDTVPAIELRGYKKNVGDIQALGSLETVLQVQNAATPLMTVLGSGNVGIGTSNPIDRLSVAVPTGTIEIANFSKTQTTNDTGALLALWGGATGETVRGYLGFAHTGTGADTTFTGELADALNLRSEGAFQLGTNGNNIRLTVATGGNVGIGTTSPIQKLVVTSAGESVALFRNTAGADSLILFQDTATGSNYPYIGSFGNNLAFGNYGGAAGNFGIGTTTPGYKLQVAGDDTSGTQLTISGATTPTSRLYIGYDTNDNYGRIQAITEGVATRALVLNADGGNVGIGTTGPDAKLAIRGGTTGTYADGLTMARSGGNAYAMYANTNDLVFRSVTAGIDAMTIAYGGNVGIGTTSPSQKLSVSGGTNDQIVLDANGTGGGYKLWSFGIPVGTLSAPTGLFAMTAESSKDITFMTSASERLRITSAGNVGIGTTTPTELLSVAKDQDAVTSLQVANYNTGTAAQSQFVLRTDSGGGQIAAGSAANATWPDAFVVRSFSTTSNGLRLITGAGNISLEPAGNTVITSGNVGIGTTTPTAKLQISGGTGKEIQIGATAGSFTNSTYFTDLSSLTNAINFTRADGQYTQSLFTYLSTGGDSNLGLVSRGDIRMVAGGDAGKTLVIKESTGNVGIGTTTPTAKLLVKGSNSVGANIPTTWATISTGRFGVVNDDKSFYFDIPGSYAELSTFNYGTATAFPLVLNGNGGNVGIGTTTPTAQLAITTGVTEALRISGLTAGRGIFADNGASAGIFSLTRQDTVATGDLSVAAFGGIGFKGGSTAYNNAVASGYHMYVSSGGNVGIGTTTPTYKLDVTGGYQTIVSQFLRSADYGEVIRVGRDGVAGSAGIGYPTDSTLSLLTAGTERLRINSSGNVGIGETSPGTYGTLEVKSAAAVSTLAPGNLGLVDSTAQAAGTGGMLVFGGKYTDAGAYTTAGWIRAAKTNGTTANYGFDMTFGTRLDGSASMAERMRITSTGNVGIGTAAPEAKLHLQAATPVLRIGSTVALDSGTAGVLSTLAFGAHYDIYTNASIYTYNSTPYGSDLRFTTGLSGSLTDRVTILATNGNVGIGTTTPQSLLHVSASAPGIQLSPSAYGGSYSSFFGTRSGAQGVLQLGNNAENSIVAGNSVAGGFLNFIVNNSNAFPSVPNGTEAMRITNAGNVGIGTTSPSAKFQVQTGQYDLSASTYTTDIGLGGTSGGWSRAFRVVQASGSNGQNGGAFGVLGSGSTPSYAFMSIPTADLTGYDSSKIIALNNSGNVGIGTVTPTSGSRLTVATASGNAYLDIARASQSTGQVALQLSGGTSGVNWIMYQNTSSDNLSFFGNSADRMTITSAGNVGIGTASPESLLHVYKSSSSSLLADGIRVSRPGVLGSYAYMSYGNGSDTSYFGSVYSGGAKGNIILQVSDGTASIDALTVRGTGNVGIGDTTPDAKFEILQSSDVATQGLQISRSNDTDFMRLYMASGLGGLSDTLIFSSAFAGDVAAIGRDGSAYFAGKLGIASSTPSAALSVGTVLAVSTVDTSNNIFSVATSTGTSYFDIMATGNVGVGTTSPKSNFTVVGAGCFSGGTGSTVACGTTAGSIYYRAANVGTYDVAENYQTSDPSINAGTIASLDLSSGMTITTATPGSIPLGIVSTDPGLILGGSDASANQSLARPIALSGRVPVKVSTMNGAIAIGDRLMLSTTTPGVAVKALHSGQTIGIALETYSAPTLGTVETFVSSQYWLAPQDFAIDATTGTMGIGTTTPTNTGGSNYRLAVGGDILATGFVNLSEGDSKADIQHISTTTAESFLDTIRGLMVAEYHYKNEPASAGRVGLIAEEAPQIVRSTKGNGIDLYKLLSVAIGGVQSLANKFDELVALVSSLTARVVALENGSGVSGAVSGAVGNIAGALESALTSQSVSIANGTVTTQVLATHQFVATPDENGDAPAGTATIRAGETSVLVRNILVAESSKVFVTFNSNTGSGWFVSEKTAGAFSVSLNAPLQTDASFDYFVVDLATSTPTFPPSSPLTPHPSPLPPGDSQAPTILINGNNPATITVGDSYADLGASVTDNVDQNLGITTLLDGIETITVNLDTSAPGTHTVTYRATDVAGNTASVDRTILIETSPSH